MRDWTALEGLLARADRFQQPEGGFEGALFQLFEVARPPAGDWPVAAVTRIIDAGVIDNEWWMRADPVHLQPAGGGLLLTDAAEIDLNRQDASALAAELMEVLTADGWLLKAAHAQRWYLRPPTAPEIRTYPLTDVMGRDIHQLLPHGPEAKKWRTLLNEIQILLHTSSVNQRRETREQSPVNSLWFWGGGRLPPRAACAWRTIWADDPLTQGLARLAGISSNPVPDTYISSLSKVTPDDATLVVINGLRRAVAYNDADTWRKRLLAINEHWIEPAVDALTRGDLSGITLYTDTGHGFALTARSQRRWWRRRQPVSAYR